LAQNNNAIISKYLCFDNLGDATFLSVAFGNSIIIAQRETILVSNDSDLVSYSDLIHVLALTASQKLL